MRSRCGRRAFRASPIRCVGERIMATGVPEFREVAWRAWIAVGPLFCRSLSVSEGGDKIKGHPTRRQVIWSLCSDPLLGRDEVTRTNRGRRRHKWSR
ncbi:hypothetical protein [Bathymodiolus japonicus methanotrophic gill symbiont]|uniref:hypothetical protein n=1 Tax=Bathymodiolus japonicus methanotrophic gill symbiont TaxID=113269 RepID=UPI001C8DD374|nr:hypothetical protein [Bathymodiolus japonicus methanotrophic gill symbiont]